MREIDLICSGTGGTFLSMCGAYQAISDKGFKVKRVACTSGSSLPMGLGYGLGLYPKEILDLCVATNIKKLIRFHPWAILFRGSLFNTKNFHKWLRRITNNVTLKDLYCENFAVNAVDANTNESVVFNKHNAPDMLLADAIMATTSIPGVFPPFRYKGRYWVDGGVDRNILTGIYQDHPRQKIVLVEKDTKFQAKALTSKLQQPIIASNDKKPSVLAVARFAVHNNLTAANKRYLGLAQGAILIEVPAISVEHPFWLTTKEKRGLFMYAKIAVAAALEVQDG